MDPERFDPNLFPGGTQLPCNANCKAVVDSFFELFQLLEAYAPVWFTEDLRNRALDAHSALNKS